MNCTYKISRQLPDTEICRRRRKENRESYGTEFQPCMKCGRDIGPKPKENPKGGENTKAFDDPELLAGPDRVQRQRRGGRPRNGASGVPHNVKGRGELDPSPLLKEDKRAEGKGSLSEKTPIIAGGCGTPPLESVTSNPPPPIIMEKRKRGRPRKPVSEIPIRKRKPGRPATCNCCKCRLEDCGLRSFALLYYRVGRILRGMWDECD